MVHRAPPSHVIVGSTSFDEGPIPLLEDRGNLSQTGQSISLVPFSSVSLESGSIGAARTAFHGIVCSTNPSKVKVQCKQ